MKLPHWAMKLLFRRRYNRLRKQVLAEQMLSVSQVKDIQKKSYAVGYTDGKREGIALSRTLAEKQLRSILWQQNQNHSAPKVVTRKP